MEINKINSLVELFFIQYRNQDKNNIFLNSLKDSGNKCSWEQAFTKIIKLSKEISKYINKGDRCLLISENRPEWMITDLSIMLASGITVPAYTTYVERDYEYIIDDCAPSLIFVSDFKQYEKIKNIIPKKNFIKKVINFDPIDNLDKNFYLSLNEIYKINEDINIEIPKLKISRKDPACIIYTSGTQGNPKGVVLSHGGILNNCEGGYELLKPLISKQTRFLTWLT